MSYLVVHRESISRQCDAGINIFTADFSGFCTWTFKSKYRTIHGSLSVYSLNGYFIMFQQNIQIIEIIILVHLFLLSRAMK